MRIVHQSKAKALKGSRSLSYQVVGPDSTGARRFMITVVRARPGGGTPLHEHRTVESMYYILEGRAEVMDGMSKKTLGPDTAIYFPAGGSHGIRNVGRGTLVYLSCHAPPYDIEELYRAFQREAHLVSTGG